MSSVSLHPTATSTANVAPRPHGSRRDYRRRVRGPCHVDRGHDGDGFEGCPLRAGSRGGHQGHGRPTGMEEAGLIGKTLAGRPGVDVKIERERGLQALAVVLGDEGVEDVAREGHVGADVVEHRVDRGGLGRDGDPGIGGVCRAGKQEGGQEKCCAAGHGGGCLPGPVFWRERSWSGSWGQGGRVRG